MDELHSTGRPPRANTPTTVGGIAATSTAVLHPIRQASDVHIEENHPNTNNTDADEETMEGYKGVGSVARPSAGGRLFGTYRLSEIDESILLHHNVRVIAHLGEGWFGHVWKGRYSVSGTLGYMFYH